MIGHGCMIGPPAATGKGVLIIPAVGIVGVTDVVGWRWIKVVGVQQRYAEGNYIVVVPEMEILNESNDNIAVNGTAYASESLYAPSYAFDGVLEGYYMTPWKTNRSYVANTQCWLAYYKQSGMNVKKIRFYKNAYNYPSFVDAIAYGSKNSLNGLDGDWTQLVSGITVGNAGWTEYQIQTEA